jgi:hypothetical protein
METMSWLVAEEHDTDAFARLGTALKALGYVLNDQKWGVVGSQEISTWELCSPTGSVIVTAETYMGLSVSGPPALVVALQEQYSAVTR